jgi:hypothetical protein
MATATIACFVPNGLVLRAGPSPIVINGPKGHEIDPNKGPTAYLTDVDADFWAEWLATYSQSSIVLSGAVAAIG